jgi:hypothetical protein
MIWARISSKVMSDPPLSGLFLSVSAKMTHFLHEGKDGLCRDGFSYTGQGRSKGSEYHTMRTYTHGVIEYLLYAKRPRHEQRLAILGRILPDVFLALGFVAHSLLHWTKP